MPQTSKSLLSPTKSMVSRGNHGNQGQTVMYLESSETIKHSYWISQLKICPKLQIPSYHQLNQWFLGAINGSQGQTVMYLESSETINNL